jgi:hypothetical protein
MPAPDAAFPTGAFPSVEALCAEQRARVTPLLPERTRDLLDEELAASMKPSCVEDPSVLRTAHVAPGGPFLAFTAVTFETGAATESALVALTRAGWIAVNPVFLRAEHDDPGCPSITRENGILEVKVERGQLVVVDGADRGWGEASSLMLERARVCRLDRASITCDPEVTVAASLAGASETNELFRSTYTIADDGTLLAARAWEDPGFVE